MCSVRVRRSAVRVAHPTRVEQVARADLRFDVRDDGPLDGEPVLLLHGFPQTTAAWDGVAHRLLDEGCRVLVPLQRGYSPLARPAARSAYRLDELVGDAVAVLDEAGVERAHVVGHDWGGVVAWQLAAARTERVASACVLSTPHPRALQESLWRSPQALQSSYVALFQLPLVPERILLARQGALLASMLRRSGLPESHVQRYVDAMLEPGALQGALGWYRAAGPSSVGEIGPSRVPTTYVWSSRDPALGRVAADRTGRHVDAPYRYEVLEAVEHWIPELAPDHVTTLVSDQIARAS